jgi:hypothetical protein
MIKPIEEAVLKWGTLVLAAVFFMSPWVFGFNDVPAAAWTAWIEAPAIAMISLAFSSAEGAKWAAMIVGIFTTVSSWVLGFSDNQAATAVLGTIGLIITIIAGVRFWLRP